LCYRRAVVHEPSSPATEDTLVALWSPRRLADDSTVRLVLLVGITVVLLACRLTAVVLPLAAILLAVAALRGGGVALCGLAAVGAAIALGLNAVTEPGTPVWSLGPVVITDEGVRYGIDRAIRIVGLVGMGRLAVEWIDPWSLAETIDRGRSGGGIGSLGARLGLTVGLALRLVPALREEAARLMLATRTRPARGRGVGPARMRELMPLFLPLLAGTIRRADEVARTLDARCFGTGPRSSRLEAAPRAGRLIVAVGVALAVALLLVPGRG
jgi:energy-coupling factor transport system permease protein